MGKRTRKRSGGDEADREIDDLISTLSKNHGEGIAQRMSSDGLSIHLPGVIPTGSESMDLAIGRGGAPRGRIMLVSADEGAGKTTLCLHLCANVQRAGGYAVYIDAEWKLDMTYAKGLGVDIDRLILSQPRSAEQAFGVVDDVLDIQAKRVKAGGKDVPILIIIDSIGALPTEQELDEKDNPGTQARAWSSWLKKVNAKVSAGSASLVLISQHRVKIGVMFGDGKVTACGKAPRFYCTVGIKMVPKKGLKEGGQLIGRYIDVEVWKNQIAPPFRRCQLLIRFGKGIDYVHSLHDALLSTGLAEKHGGKTSSWYVFREGSEDEIKYQGVSGLRSHLVSPERRKKLIRALRDRYGWDG